MMQRGIASLDFRPDVEGLRAVAIVPVVLYHTAHGLAPGGYVGVDVFFVISGFLITRIILEDLRRDRFTYAAFYLRRIRRIFPALFFMLVVVSVTAAYVLTPKSFAEFGRTLIATGLFCSNFAFTWLAAYFAPAAELKPLLHTWSLAVEEQFYLLFPAVLVATKRWFGGRHLAVIGVLAVISLALAVATVQRFPTAAFYLGPPRAFELMIGAALACDGIPVLTGRLQSEILALLGASLIVLAIATFGVTTTRPIPASLVPCLGAAAIIYAGRSQQTIVGALLALPPVRFVGAISYSLYLWHWPALSLARNFSSSELTPPQIFGVVAFSAILAIFSWRYVERPFRTGLKAPKTAFAIAGGATLAAVVLGMIIVAEHGFPGRFSPEIVRLFNYADDFSPYRATCHDELSKPVPYAKSCLFGSQSPATIVAVWGDSHGVELAAALGERAGNDEAVMEVTSSSCPPAIGIAETGRADCIAHARQSLAGLIGDARVKTVVLVAYYGAYDTPEARIQFTQGFEGSVAQLTKAGKRVVIVNPVPTYPAPVPRILGMQVRYGLGPGQYHISFADYLRRNGPSLAFLDRVSRVYHADQVHTENVFCTRAICRPYDGVGALYFDEHHLSMRGARELAGAVKQKLDGPR